MQEATERFEERENVLEKVNIFRNWDQNHHGCTDNCAYMALC